MPGPLSWSPPPPAGAARYLAIEDPQGKRHHVEMYSPTRLHPFDRNNVNIWAAFDLRQVSYLILVLFVFGWLLAGHDSTARRRLSSDFTDQDSGKLCTI